MKKGFIAMALTACVAMASLTGLPVKASGEGKSPVVMSFGSVEERIASGTSFFTRDDGIGGSYEFINKDGVDCLKLNYSEISGMAPYRCMPRFSEAGRVSTDLKYVRLTYMTDDPGAHTITLRNNALAQKLALTDNTAASGGKWVTTPPVDISAIGLIDRFAAANHCTIEYNSGSTNASFYIKELAFFDSEEAAYAYYGDTPAALHLKSITFDENYQKNIASFPDLSAYSVDDHTGEVSITRSLSTFQGASNYNLMVRFEQGVFSPEYKYLRVCYSAKNPGGAPVELKLFNNATGEGMVISGNIADTDEFVLTDTIEITTASLLTRLENGLHDTLSFCSKDDGGLYKIKGLYFFKTAEEAALIEMTTEETDRTVTANGVAISNYRIVISENAPERIVRAANRLNKRINELIGVQLSIVNDSVPATQYEILIGDTNRPESKSSICDYTLDGFDICKYEAKFVGNKLVFISPSAFGVDECVGSFIKSGLYDGFDDIPETIEIGNFAMNGKVLTNIRKYDWAAHENISDPMTFTDDFSTDNGYWTEEGTDDHWSFSVGKYVSDASDLALSFIQIYETNVDFSADFTFSAIHSEGEAGITLRYTAADAYLRAGYDFENGEWFIDTREGSDFLRYRAASAKAQITPGTYRLRAVADGSVVKLYVNGELVLTADKLTQFTPGRVGIYSEKIGVSVDNAEIIFLSGEGTILKDVKHTILPDDKYREGGTVLETPDGKLTYIHMSGATFKSSDDGASWERSEMWTNTLSYPNILKLRDGSYIKNASKVIDGVNYFISSRSTDGVNWVDGGVIAPTTLTGSTEYYGTNMNDKFTEMSNGRIFYCQNYENKTAPAAGDPSVFSRIFYSDDKGMTWTESTMNTTQIPGNSGQYYFGESKIIETPEGVRLYSSWNTYGCIVYSDSTDDGATWGELKRLDEFQSARSSMQIARDAYADNETTYYMVWVNAVPQVDLLIRPRLSLTMSTDGMNWEYLGDLWRWESNYWVAGIHLNHVVDPFVYVTEDRIIAGSGFSEKLGAEYAGDHVFHQGQRQHIYSVAKPTLASDGMPSDVKKSDWFYDNVKFVTENALIDTVSGRFNPHVTTTRETLVTALWRAAGSPVVDCELTFRDIENSDIGAIKWAYSAGIVNGFDAEHFAPKNEITREQMAAIFYRYAKHIGRDMSARADLETFADSDKISSYAVEPFSWAVANGLINGIGGGLISPAGNAERCQTAAILERFCGMVG